MNLTAQEMLELGRIQAMIEVFRASASRDAVEQLASYLEETVELFQEELDAWEDED